MHLSVFNPKGGTGKTLLSIQLAAAFARTGARVALIDHDPQASDLGRRTMMGIAFGSTHPTRSVT